LGFPRRIDHSAHQTFAAKLDELLEAKMIRRGLIIESIPGIQGKALLPATTNETLIIRRGVDVDCAIVKRIFRDIGAAT
jgi:hypothetical protein